MPFLYLLVIALFVWWLVRTVQRGGFGGETPFQCVNCRHCRKLFDDGVRCGYGAKEVFKNPAQIGMCHDHQRK